MRESQKAHFRIRVALILSPSDLGTAFSLFRKSQKYSAFLGLELSFVYRDRLLVVMPNGYGYAVNGDPDPKASAVLKKLTAPGANATKEVQAAIVAVQGLAASEGHRLTVPKVGGSTSRDRITIAAAVTAAIALIAAFVLYRRATGLVVGFQQRVAPTMARVNAILDDVKDVTAKVKEETDRVDHAIRSTMDRVDDTADRVRSNVRAKTSQIIGLVRGLRVVIEGMLHFGSRPKPPADGADRVM